MAQFSLKLMTRALCVLLSCALGISAYASDRFNSDQLKTVLRVETAPDMNGHYEIGTGFLIGTSDGSSARVLLVTNKHMIGDWNYADASIANYRPYLNVYFYRTKDPSSQTYRASRVDLMRGDTLDISKVHLHPDGHIDLVAIDVTDKVNDPQEHIEHLAYDRSYLLPFDKVQAWQTDITDQVIALGYPLGIRSLRNNYPIAKIGYLASVPGQEVSIPISVINRAGRSVDVTVDGLITNGNSGSPVLLVGGTRMRRDPTSHAIEFLDTSIPNYVVGVVSSGLGPSGLTVVISSDYLLDLLPPQPASTALSPQAAPK